MLRSAAKRRVMPPKELMRGFDMDTNLAWEMIRVSFSVGRGLRDLLLRLKKQCSAEEYKGHARAIAGAIHGVNTALIDRALAAQPEREDRIEAELAEFGRIR